jgi:hypothetical protein
MPKREVNVDSQTGHGESRELQPDDSNEDKLSNRLRRKAPSNAKHCAAFAVVRIVAPPAPLC